jgi:hypothetical protein
MTAACRTHKAVDLRSRHPARWQSAVNRLLADGQLEAAEYAARFLHRAYPALPYPRNLCGVFDRLPPLESQPSFKSDPRRDVQIVRNGDADALLLLFCGAGHRLGLPLPLIHRWFGRLPAHLVYLRDFRRLFFMKGVPSLGADRAATAAGLRAIAGSFGARRILCYGNSAGAFAALHYGLCLEADAVLAMSGPTNLSADFNMHLSSRGSAARLRASLPEETVDMRRAYAAAERPPRVRLVHSDSHWDDRLQAENMSGLPGAMLQPIEGYAHHNVVAESIRRGLFDEQLAWLMGR